MRVPSGGGNWNHPEWRRRLERAPPLRLVDRPLPPIRHVQTGQSVGGRRAAHHGRRKNIGETSLWKPVSHGDHSKDREAQLACGRSSGAARATRSTWSLEGAALRRADSCWRSTGVSTRDPTERSRGALERLTRDLGRAAEAAARSHPERRHRVLFGRGQRGLMPGPGVDRIDLLTAS